MFLLGKSFLLFLLAGLCEIGGGYLVWQWWRNGASWFYGAAGAAVLFLYGVVPTYQPAHFGRVYAAYGGVFVVLSERVRVDAMKRFADSWWTNDCNMLQSSRFRGLLTAFPLHKPLVTPSYSDRKHQFRREKEGIMPLKGGS